MGRLVSTACTAADRESLSRQSRRPRTGTRHRRRISWDGTKSARPSRMRAHHAFLKWGDAEGAAESALLDSVWTAAARRGQAPASGWFARAARILDEANSTAPRAGIRWFPRRFNAWSARPGSGASRAFSQAGDVAPRFDDHDLASLACQGRGRALIHLDDPRGCRAAGRAMVAVIARGVADPVRRHLLQRAGGVPGHLRSASCLRVDDFSCAVVRHVSRIWCATAASSALPRGSDAVAWQLVSCGTAMRTTRAGR